ncbi:phospholipase effector Tle1 domain-containing protein [Hyphomicrobium sp. 2TAF46]|uniref:phospholipase effector Tle1 domain-containing protein n=1 Tax=Hyphomicrobium sp. 2TAF46 TaxID=3233019 RepID=UPI003F93B895
MKRLICSLDGTWNDDDGASPLTNVAKLNRAIPLEDPHGTRQLVRYVVGIATSQNQGWSFLKGALGFEIGDRIKAGYRFLSNAYEPGDEIYLFGFSRGAYEARSLASFITLFGLARKDGDFSIDEAWAIYRQPEHKRDFNAVAKISASCHYPVRIRCLGVWDTVGNIGNPFWSSAWLSRRFGYHDMRMHDTIDVALHALSIDETRSPFRPSLFSYPDDTQLPAHQHVEQTWFAGTHADVGGGWPETALSDIALLWMAERILATTDLAIDIEKLKRESSPDHLGLQHYSLNGWIYAFSRIVPYVRLIRQGLESHVPSRSWRTSKLGHGLTSLNETIHQSALMRLGQTVKEARAKVVQDIVYEPPTLVNVANAAIPLAPTPLPAVRRRQLQSPLNTLIPAAPAIPAADDIAAEAIGEPPASPPPPDPENPAAEILQAETMQTEKHATAKNGAANDLREGVDMPETNSALKARDPVIPAESDMPAVEIAPAKIKIVTVHGTGAGVPDDVGQSWWQKDSAFQKKTAEIVELAGDGIEVVPFHWGAGPNSETMRRAAGAKLYEQLRGYDEAGIDYYVIGHSHGGSVIYDALLRSAAKAAPLERLKSWLTVGTPFLDFKPSWLLFNRLNIWGQVVYVTGIGILLLAIGILTSRYLDLPFAQTVSASLGDKAFANFYYPMLSFFFGYAIMCFGILTVIERLTKRWYSDRDKTAARDLYEKKWVGLWHHDDEAISALANVRALHRAIIPSNFLVPVFSLIPLLITIFGLGYAFFYLVHSWNPDTQWLKDIFAKLATVDADPKKDWTLQSLFSTISALATSITFIMGPIIGIYLLITTVGIGLFRGFAHLIGIPLAKAIDRLVWDSVRQETWGNDRRGESVRSVSPTPPLFSPRYVPLPDAVASKIARYSEMHATETLRKARELLGMTATATAVGDVGRDLSQQLSWRELIHTSYFEIDEFIALLAAALRRNGLSAAKAAKIAEAISDDMAEEWLRDISAVPGPLPADEVRSRS